ncbi:MAG: hypothetical protein ACRD2O_11420, partial [Terriglobia bacterium]
ALSSAPKPHTNNGGGGDTAATATNLHHYPTLPQLSKFLARGTLRQKALSLCAALPTRQAGIGA